MLSLSHLVPFSVSHRDRLLFIHILPSDHHVQASGPHAAGASERRSAGAGDAAVGQEGRAPRCEDHYPKVCVVAL